MRVKRSLKFHTLFFLFTVREYWRILSLYHFARCYLKLVFLPQLSIIDTRQAKKNLTIKDKNLLTRIK